MDSKLILISEEVCPSSGNLFVEISNRVTRPENNIAGTKQICKEQF
jgi:hypothetical protein